MRIEELVEHGIPEQFVRKLELEKIKELYPPQSAVLEKDLLETNLMISMPTAGGKTLIATLAMIKKMQEKRCKVIYIVPLVALGNEKYNYFKDFFSDQYKVALSVGEYDSTDPQLANYDIIVVTSEKMDSLLRHKISWAKEIGLVVADEIHLINEPSRGPTLEILLTKLRELCPKANILALSATVRNAKEIADWLNADLILSDFRPVKLYQGISYDSKIMFPGHEHSYELFGGEPEEDMVNHTLKMEKQCLFFVSTRRSAESLAEKLSKTAISKLTRVEASKLKHLASDVQNAIETPTVQCKRLANCVTGGVAFHHAGLVGKQKRLIEEGFRAGLIKVICATPTLAMGVNIPAFRAIIRDTKRYYQGIGSAYIPVLDYYQMVGRCGRPQYDDFGESVLIAKNEEEAHELTERFIFGEPEEIRSKLAVEPVLRVHILALIASEFCKSEGELLDFFSKTFHAFHFDDLGFIEEKLQDILDMLEEWEFIVRDGKRLRATQIGKRISELYLDPMTANKLIQALEKAHEDVTPFSFLQTISNTLEMQPLLNVRVGEVSEMQDIIISNGNSFLLEIPEEYDLEFEDFLKSIKTSLLFEAWINESTEDAILTKFKVAPGEMRTRLLNADWLMYSLSEIALISGYKNIIRHIRKLRVRLRYGVKEELLPLVRLKDIGRMRARKLWNSNLRTIEDLRKVPMDSLSRLMGTKVAVSIKRQLEHTPDKSEKNPPKQISDYM